MRDIEEKLTDRFYELYGRACERYTPQYTKFLDLEEQRILASTGLPAELYGGYEGAERVVACFGGEGEFPIVCVKIAPKGEKWADELTHRDFLGSLMGLKISRELIGDIIVCGKTAYVLCLDGIAEFIKSELAQVKRTAVDCTVMESLPDVALPVPEQTELVISSNRLDSIVAAAWKLSRSEAKALFDENKVFVNSKPVVRPEKEAAEGDIISFRGRGRIRYLGIVRETAKGRLRALAEVW